MTDPRERRSREDYERGLPDHHDPTAGFGGAAPAQSALSLRAGLAGFGLVSCVLLGVLVLRTDLPAWGAIALFVVAAASAVDLAVVLRRKARGEPG